MKRAPAPTSELRKITPTIAARMLKHNGHNRSLSEFTVDRYAEEMKAGHWISGTDAIAFDVDDHLVNGQHRLHAVIKSGATIECFVIQNAPKEAFSKIDTGKVRRSADVLSIVGEKNVCVLASTLILLERYFTGTISSANWKAYRRFNNDEILTLLEKYPAVRESVVASHISNLKKLMAGSATPCALHYLFMQKDQEKTMPFLEGVASGATLASDSPIFVLRERLMQNAISKQKYPQPYLMGLCIKAWNLYRKGKTVRVLIFRDDEEFPIVS